MEREAVEYRVIKSPCDRELMEVVSAHLGGEDRCEGGRWQLHGHMTIINRENEVLFAQALVRYDFVQSKRKVLNDAYALGTFVKDCDAVSFEEVFDLIRDNEWRTFFANLPKNFIFSDDDQNRSAFFRLLQQPDPGNIILANLKSISKYSEEELRYFWSLTTAHQKKIWLEKVEDDLKRLPDVIILKS